MECETCLTNPKADPDLLGPLEPLRGLVSNNNSNNIINSTAFVANILLRAGTFQIHIPEYRRMSEYKTWRDTRALLMKRYLVSSEDVNMFRIAGREQDSRNPDYIPTAERFFAHITARYPLATIIGADVSLPKTTKVEGASEKPFVTMTLQVRWDRAIGVLAAILGGEVLAVVGLLGWCWWKGVMVRDHASYLSVANLMRPALQKAAGVTEIRSVDTGMEIARKMEKWGMTRLRYQAVTQANGCSEVSLLDRGAQGSFDNGRFIDGRYH